MTDYRKMYGVLFNAVTDVVELLQSNADANSINCAALLMAAQLRCEELYIDGENDLSGSASLQTPYPLPRAESI